MGSGDAAGDISSHRDGLPKTPRKVPSASDAALNKVSVAPRDSPRSSSGSPERADSSCSSSRRARSRESEYSTPSPRKEKEPPQITPRKVGRWGERSSPKARPERQKRRGARTSSRSRSPKAKQQASSSGAQRSIFPRSMWGFDVGKYRGNWKSAADDFFRRLLHKTPDDPPFGTYHTVKDEEGKFRSTLRLSDKAFAAARLRKREYEGEVGSTQTEAELSAARALWDEPRIREIAANLHPSKKKQRRRTACQEFEARRKAHAKRNGRGQR
eukprot:s376_g16.t1